MLGLWDTEISWVSICGEGFRETHTACRDNFRAMMSFPCQNLKFCFLDLHSFHLQWCVCLCVSEHACVLVHVYSICVVGTCSREFRTWEAAWFRVELANWASKLFLYSA